MSDTKEIYQQLSRLMPLEKLQLAEMLLADLDVPDPEIEAVWSDEAQARWRAYQAGQLTTRGYDEVMRKYK